MKCLRYQLQGSRKKEKTQELWTSHSATWKAINTCLASIKSHSRHVERQVSMPPIRVLIRRALYDEVCSIGGPNRNFVCVPGYRAPRIGRPETMLLTK